MTGGLVIFQDQPNYWDAWGSTFLSMLFIVFLTALYLDVEVHHLETRHPLKFSNVSVVAQGPLRAAVKAELKYGQSSISVTVR